MFSGKAHSLQLTDTRGLLWGHPRLTDPLLIGSFGLLRFDGFAFPASGHCRKL
jgi:hypothetical protein